jgi:predicted metal-binding membrane protein
LALEQTSPRAFIGVCAALFATSAALTIFWCISMSTMRGMPMPGGWTMSMMWMRMPGRTWLAAAASFVGMWVVMMIAMMLPSLTTMLWCCRQTVAIASGTRKAGLTTLIGVGYFLVWTLLGVAVYLLGVGLAAIEMKQPVVARAIPFAAAAIVLIAGAIQFTSFKTRHLGCCRAAPGRSRPALVDARTALGFGLYLGITASTAARDLQQCCLRLASWICVPCLL